MKTLPANAGDMGSIPGSGRSHRKGNATWEIPWPEKTGGLQSLGSQKSRIQLSDKTTTIKENS